MKGISELEGTLIPRPLCAKPLYIISLDPIPKEMPKTSYKVKKVPKLLYGIRTYVVENISKG